jgi:hypothetical protein
MPLLLLTVATLYGKDLRTCLMLLMLMLLPLMLLMAPWR